MLPPKGLGVPRSLALEGSLARSSSRPGGVLKAMESEGNGEGSRIGQHGPLFGRPPSSAYGVES